MKERKFLKVAKRVSKEEREQFSEYLASPFFNKSDVINRLWLVVKEELNSNGLFQFSTQEILVQIGVNSKNEEAYLNQLFSTLLKLMNDFLSLVEFRQGKLNESFFLLQSYIRRGVDNEQVNQVYHDAKRQLELLPVNDEVLDFRYRFEMEYGKYLFRRLRSPLGGQLQLILQSLRDLFASRWLEITIAKMNHDAVFPSNLESQDYRVIENLIQEDDPLQSNMVKARLMTYQLLKEQQETYQIALMELLEDEDANLDRNIRQELYSIGLNYFLILANQGSIDATKRAESFYSILLDKGLLTNQGKVTEEHIKNIVSIRCKLGFVEEARHCLDSYGSQIKALNPELALRYNQAVVNFYEDKFSQAARDLNDLIGRLKEDVYYGLDARSFWLMAQYELNDPDLEEVLVSFIQAFRKFLLRNGKLREEKKQSYLDFTSLYKKLRKFRLLSRSNRLKKELEFSKQIENSRIPNKGWFQKKTKELI